MQVIQLRFIINIQNAKRSITLVEEMKRALNIVDNTDEYALIIEVFSSNGSKTAVTNAASGGEAKVSDFNDHIDSGELVTVTINKLLI